MAFIILVLAMLAFMYLLVIRPQRQQQRRHEAMVANLKIGDEVITSGGIYGDVNGLDDEKVHLLICEDVEIEVARRAIATVLPAASPESAEDEVLESDEPGVAGEPVDHALPSSERA